MARDAFLLKNVISLAKVNRLKQGPACECIEVSNLNDGTYGTTDDITAILSNIVVLVAKGRLSPRRAAVLTDALSLMLRSVVVMDRITESTPPQIIWDAPRPIRDATLLRKPLTMPPRITRACEPDPCPSPCSPIHM